MTKNKKQTPEPLFNLVIAFHTIKGKKTFNTILEKLTQAGTENTRRHAIGLKEAIKEHNT